jgi:hypothetical protein
MAHDLTLGNTKAQLPSARCDTAPSLVSATSSERLGHGSPFTLLAATLTTLLSAIDNNPNAILDELHNSGNLNIHSVGCRPLPCLSHHGFTPWGIPV